jgi:hypothetical protein
MSDTTVEGATTESQVRTFWPSDYKRFALLIKSIRRASNDMNREDVATAIEAACVQVFTTDSPVFDANLFSASTREHPAYYGELARALERSRHVVLQPHTPKPAEQQVTVDALMQAIESILAPDPRFSAHLFEQVAAYPGLRGGSVTVTAETPDDEEDDDEAEDDVPGF